MYCKLYFMKKLENLKLSNTFAKLGADFLQEKSPDPVSNPYLIDSNPTAIKLIGLELSEIKKNKFIEYFSGNRLLPNSKPFEDTLLPNCISNKEKT